MTHLSFQCEFAYASGFRLDAAFETEPGVTALVGPSGSGKTTILSLIAGLLRPASGRIVLADRVLVDTQARVFLPPQRRRVGLVFQDRCLFPHLTVRRNLQYAQRRKPHRSIDFDAIVDILEIGALLDRRPQTLSGGQQQRVALGRALLAGPELLLLDEPLSGLDVPLQSRIIDFLKRLLSEYEIPALLVTHQAEQVESLASQIITLEHGHTVAKAI